MSLETQANSIIESKKPKKEKIRALCDLVREIPYKRIDSLDPKEMVKKGRGSCTPKHIFLADYLKKLNIPVRLLIIPFYYKKMKLKYPRSKMALVNKMPISYHIALKAKINEQWIIIDVTWDSKLKGFPHNAEWGGSSDMKLAVTPEKIIETKTDPRKFEKRALKKYSEKELKIRKEFYRFFDEFLVSSRG